VEFSQFEKSSIGEGGGELIKEIEEKKKKSSTAFDLKKGKFNGAGPVTSVKKLTLRRKSLITFMSQE